MLKLTFCLRRRPELSRETFLRYWREEHSRLMETHMPALGAVRYRQMRALDGPLAEAVARSRSGPEPFDGTAEVWWESEAAFRAATATPEARAAAKALIEDEARFIDLRNSPIFLSEAQFCIDMGAAADDGD